MPVEEVSVIYCLPVVLHLALIWCQMFYWSGDLLCMLPDYFITLWCCRQRVITYFCEYRMLHDKPWLIKWVRHLLNYQCNNILMICPNLSRCLFRWYIWASQHILFFSFATFPFHSNVYDHIMLLCHCSDWVIAGSKHARHELKTGLWKGKCQIWIVMSWRSAADPLSSYHFSMPESSVFFRMRYFLSK